ncbi:glutathione S-transferase family protein [uncultured Sulfitobacter sp.]|uniref:glutathione S-transferase family protein n=1 Tax=uncultured Sulfitobacter sp. TaxID=191468 RepID=UPI002618DB02|nr:glutathione S-transferase family protein [uncultured Sulfitobacter sp.]
MQLYCTKGTISVAVALALHEAGIEHRLVRVDFASAEQTRDPYLQINPKGRVPALELDDGTVLTETGALLEYIADIAPAARLVPEDPAAAARMRGVMYYLASTMHVAHAHKMRGSRWADNQSSFDDMTAKVPQTMDACAAFVEDHCLSGDYVAGEAFSIADAYLYIVCNWLEGDGVSVTKYPKINGFLDRMAARDSVKAARDAGLL